MATPISIVGQNGMDQFYQNYRAPSDFFVLDDFIFHSCAALGDFYLKQFEIERGKLRQDKQDAVVAFSHDWLSEELLQVKHEKGETYVQMSNAVMSFPYDKQDTGLQEVLPVKPLSVKLERSNVSELWQYDLLPNTNRIFWRKDGKKIRFFNKGSGNIEAVRILYVPGIGAEINKDLLVPDSLVKYAIDTAINTMLERSKGIVVKKSNDNNPNKTLETEVDTGSMKKA